MSCKFIYHCVFRTLQTTPSEIRQIVTVIMHFSLSTFAFLGFLPSIFSAPAPDFQAYAIKERHAIPRGWTAVSRAEASRSIMLQIGLKQHYQDKLEQHIIEVSNPSHTRYGQYLSADAVHELLAPSDDTIDLVKAWLLDHNIINPILSSTKDWISFTLPIGKAERLLQTEYSVFQNSKDGSILVRAPEWSLPQHLHQHIDIIQPTTSFFRPVKHARLARPKLEPVRWGDGNWWRPPHYLVSPRHIILCTKKPC